MTENKTIRADVRIPNEKGLHARASAKFVKCSEAFTADVSVLKDDQRVGGTSIMGLLMLAASRGSMITVEATGPDALEAISALTTLVETGFGELS